MSIWRTLWCFYNSSAFETIASLALLGSLVVILPALITLPSAREVPLGGNRKTPYIDFNNSRTWSLWLGVATALLSLIPPLLYFKLLQKFGGETCNVKEDLVSDAYLRLISLYASTALVLAGFSWFYVKWKQTLKLDKSF